MANWTVITLSKSLFGSSFRSSFCCTWQRAMYSGRKWNPLGQFSAGINRNLVLEQSGHSSESSSSLRIGLESRLQAVSAPDRRRARLQALALDCKLAIGNFGLIANTKISLQHRFNGLKRCQTPQMLEAFPVGRRCHKPRKILIASKTHICLHQESVAFISS